MSVTLNSALSGHVTADNPAINVVFPSSQEIAISGPEDTITPVDDNGTYVALATEAKQDTLIAAVDGVEATLTQIEANQLPDNHQVTVSSSALPTGAATELKQDTIINHVDGIETLLTSIDAGVPTSLGQTTMSASMPVTVASDQSALPALQSGTWNVFTSGYQGTLTDRSGQATTTSAQIAPTNANRRYFFIMNLSGGTIWIDFGTAAVTTQPSIRLNSGDSFVMESNFISTDSINVIANSGTRDFVAKEG